MLNLTAYMDETGHSGDTAYVGMAGLVAPAAARKRFTRDWNAVLNRAGIKFFHMREFAHSRGQFKSWKNKSTDRDALYGKLFAIIKDTKPIMFGAIVSIAD